MLTHLKGNVSRTLAADRFIRCVLYPPHLPRMRRLGGGTASACGGPLMLPEQAGARVQDGHLYCAKCAEFLVSTDEQTQQARLAAKCEWFDMGSAVLAEPFIKRKSVPTIDYGPTPTARQMTLLSIVLDLGGADCDESLIEAAYRQQTSSARSC